VFFLSLKSSSVIVISIYVITTALMLPAMAGPLVGHWSSLMMKGSSAESERDFNLAIQQFKEAVEFARSDKLGNNYVEQSLARESRAEMLGGYGNESEKTFSELIRLAQDDKATRGFIPQEAQIWLLDLADAYISHFDPRFRETCLRNGTNLRILVLGTKHKDTIAALFQLKEYYLDHGKFSLADRVFQDLAKGSSNDPAQRKQYAIDSLNLSALSFYSKGNFKVAENCELYVIDSALKCRGKVLAGLPAFYSLVGAADLAQGKTSGGKQHFQKALSVCNALRTPKDKQDATTYIRQLSAALTGGENQKDPAVAEVELKHILALQRLISNDPNFPYGTYNLLSIVLNDEHKTNEAEQYLEKAISIARGPNNPNKKEVPELYLRLGIYQRPSSREIDTASKTFAQALDAEPDKTGFHAILVLFWWGKHVREERNDVKGAFEKWNQALREARALPLEKRGTLVADTLVIIANSLRRSGDRKDAESLEKEALEEIQLQKRINSNLGPDHFKLLSSYKLPNR
jgi:tetratricopeptide (TPR) repeat protein